MVEGGCKQRTRIALLLPCCASACNLQATPYSTVAAIGSPSCMCTSCYNRHTCRTTMRAPSADRRKLK